jgi:DNA polymerase III gamma/tau subunit
VPSETVFPQAVRAASSQPLALTLLNAQLKQGRLASAYLFYGDADCKKEELAQAFARAAFNRTQ